MSRVEITLPEAGNTQNYSGAGTNYVVQTNGGVLYRVYRSGNATATIEFVKSTDGGFNWSNPTVIASGGSFPQLSIWYDRWSGIAADLIHVVYTEATVDDIFYRNIDAASSDALSTETTVFAGASASPGGYLSIARARGGNLGVFFSIDAGLEDGFYRSTDVGATWGVRADPSEGATQDQAILLPGWNADNQDLMAIFWDASADELSVKRYDDSADSWAETSIATSMVDLVASSGYANFYAAVDIANSQNIVAAWENTDTASAKLRCWTVTDSSITEVTNIVSSSTDDQGYCAIGIDTDTGDWYAFYGGKTDGSETFNTAMNIYYKVSTDDGSTWGSETALTSRVFQYLGLLCTPRFSGDYCLGTMSRNTASQYQFTVSVEIPVAGGGGVASHMFGSIVR